MKTNFLSWNKISALALGLLLCTAMTANAQQRGGYGGGGFGGGFGGFGGGFGGGGFGNRGGANSGSSSTSSYNNNGNVGSAMITVDPDTHNIVVIADAETSQQISNVIANLDEPKPQVLIKVVFMEVQHNDASDIGIQGSYTGKSSDFSAITGYITNYSGSNITSILPIRQSFNVGNNFGIPQTPAGASGSGGVYQLLGSDFTATLQAVAAAGKAQVLSRPSILARDGQLAKIVVGQQIYLPSGVTYTTTGSSTIPIINGTYTDIGIILDVTPYIGDNGLIEMILQPQISSVDTSTPGQLIASSSTLLGSSSTPVYAPNINIRSADTVVITPDAQTVVIGGLLSSDKASSVTKVPILGDIPVLGNLFKFTAKSATKTELLMFLTPHVIQAPTQLGFQTPREWNQVPTITNSVSEQELNQYLEHVPVKGTK
jgi:general secretion pathway protein D